MQIIHHNTAVKEQWRPGVVTRMHVSARAGSSQLSVFEQWCGPGLGAPTHLHAVEEILSVVSGLAEIWLVDERSHVGPGCSVVIPAGRLHGFRNIGTEILHIQAILAAPVFEARYDDHTEVARRWLPE
jgi:mannose-6-phosphate isomerase-like protein (cupin superfamily)